MRVSALDKQVVHDISLGSEEEMIKRFLLQHV